MADDPTGGNPLLALHDEEELAEFGDWGGTRIVTTFGAPQAEYAALRRACALLDLPQRGVLEVTGKDRHAFLNNLLTNGLIHPQTKGALPAGHGCYAFALNLKGRVVADVNVLEHPAGDRTWLEGDRRLLPLLRETFELYLFSENVAIADVAPDWHEVALHGPLALEVLQDAADAPVVFEPTPANFPATLDLPTAVIRMAGVEGLAWRDDVCGVPGLHLIVPAGRAAAIWQDLVTRFSQLDDDPRPHGRRRLRTTGWAMFNAARIEAGRPMLGIDFETAPPSRPGQKINAEEAVAEASGPSPAKGVLPAETGLFDRAVSVTSGCYLGQEVVARMHARKVTARQIVGIRMDVDALPAAATPVEVDDNPIGIVTSSTLSPVLSGAAVCLAMLKRPHFATGTKVTVAAEGQNAPGTVVPLPFVSI